ncbi:MAG: ATP-binding cassette domain-containing protein [Erysipelotrichaceae bacterium]|jgi:ABC-2 type transport system ATP-binding protein|nr:ATP-binding cassette domain-containing protein [Bacillota bacterium]MDY0118790.1 ATP-binding cassette domain-containing protein [Bacilli bacterium]NLJ32537.1 ATP-binding cassette domain-containing protein [Erysipelotrichaceae bacterium]
MEVLRATNLTKIYGSTIAVNNVSMTINEGDIYGFVGENGAGKTTFIRLVAGLADKNSGEFTLFEGENHSIGALVETPSLYLYLNAMDNLMAQGKLLGITDKEKHKELFRLVKLEYLIDSKKKAKSFSLGMKQRLGIAMCLLANPKFLLLDEPMNGLDPEGVVLMRDLIKSLSEQGITFLISSHMLGELSKVATRYGFIHEGKLIKEITREELEQSQKGLLNVKVSEENVEKLKIVLTKNNIKFDDEDGIKIYDQTIEDIVELLTKNGITLKGITEETSNIEDYYLDLIGGLHE